MEHSSEFEARAPGENTRSDQRILRMSPDGLSSSSIEATLRNRIHDLAHAIRDKDVDRLMAFYSPDVVVFDVRPPLDTRGADAYRHNFDRWFASFDGPLAFDFVELRVVPGDSTAFCHYLAMIVGKRADGRTSGYWVRGTTCFERREGQWMVTHEHISMPSPA
jgi:ketosteroid isomerase-like protein